MDLFDDKMLFSNYHKYLSLKNLYGNIFTGVLLNIYYFNVFGDVL